MGTGYTRQADPDIEPGLIIYAEDLEAEFDAIQSAFHGTTGHTHDGTTGEGVQIPLTTSVSGVLPIANGGTNGATQAAGAKNLLDGLTAKATPVAADTFPLIDSAASNAIKLVTLTNLTSAISAILPGTATLTSTDAGATAGPILTLYRNSASPATSDVIGQLLFSGKDSAANVQTYATITGLITDATSTSEDASIYFATAFGGSVTDTLVLNRTSSTFAGPVVFSSTVSTGALTTVGNSSITGTLDLIYSDDGSSVGPELNLYRISASPTAGDTLGQIAFLGRDSTTLQQTYGRMFVNIEDATAGSEDGAFHLELVGGGSINSVLSLTSSGSAIVTHTDAGSGIGPILSLYRNSSSPAASDTLGSVSFTGRDSGGNDETYAQIYAAISDPTDASEDGQLFFNVMAAGVSTQVMNMLGTDVTFAGSINVAGGISSGSVNTFTSTGSTAIAGPTLNLTRDSSSPAAADNLGQILFIGNDSGGNAHTYGAIFSSINDTTNGSEDGAVNIMASVAGTLTTMAAFSAYLYLPTNQRWGQDTTGTPGSGNNTVGGAFIASTGQLLISGSSGSIINRTADGTNLAFHSGGTLQGGISIAGATTTYGAFFGSHWAQLADGSKPGIFPGTICESIDQMSFWPDEPEGSNQRLPCFKVSDTPGSKAVYGVFAWWDDFEGDELTNDAYIGSLGAYVIRMHPTAVAQRGDYVESNGDGTGRVQVDDVLRSSTVAKITSTEVQEVYPDGSYLLPCTLHCG